MSMIRKRYQIFISSTFEDLKDERQAAVEGILTANHIPAGMELFAASDEEQWEVIKRWINESDIYMLILGGRYGSIDPKTGVSYTEMEYDYAISIEKPLFAVVLSDEALDAKAAQNKFFYENSEKYRAFKAKVMSKMIQRAKTKSDIEIAIIKAVQTIERNKEDKLIGWVRYDDKIDDPEIIKKLSDAVSEKERIFNENKALKEKIEALENLDFNDREMKKLTEVLTKQEVYHGSKKTNLFRFFIDNKDKFISGVMGYNRTSNLTQDAVKSIEIFELSDDLFLLKLIERKSEGRYPYYVLSDFGRSYIYYLFMNGIISTSL